MTFIERPSDLDDYEPFDESIPFGQTKSVSLSFTMPSDLTLDDARHGDTPVPSGVNTRFAV